MGLFNVLLCILSLTRLFVEPKELSSVTQLNEGNGKLLQMLLDKIGSLENKITEYSKALSKMGSICESKINDLKNDFTMKIAEFQRHVMSNPITKDLHQRDNYENGINGDLDGIIIEASDAQKRDTAHATPFSDKTALIQHKNADGRMTKHPIIRRSEIDQPKIAFYAKLTGHAHHLGAKQHIVFDDIVTNYGNAYDGQIGVFRAPVSGVYVISTSISALAHSSGNFGIYINQNLESWFYINGAENQWDDSSHTIIIHLNVGDDVTIRSVESDKEIAGQQHSIFSGFLLFQDQEANVVIG